MTKYYKEKIRLSPRDGLSLFFISDVHLGVPPCIESDQREQKLIQLLDDIRDSASAIFFLGDIFDFWFEYKHAIPKGFFRLFTKLSQLKEEGINLYFFTGNHDKWLDNYIEEISGSPIIFGNMQLETPYFKMLVGHGDGLGPGDRTYKLIIKPAFESRFLQRLFRWVHPDLGIGLAKAWSKHSRIKNNSEDSMKPLEKEWLYQYCKTVDEIEHHDLYIFGHRHVVIDEQVNSKSRYLNLGEWIYNGVVIKITGQNVEKIPVN